MGAALLVWWGALAAGAPQTSIDSFEQIWQTLRDHYWDRSMSGLNWQAVHDRFLHELETKHSEGEAREVMNRMIHQLRSSHLAIIPGELYGSEGGKDGAGTQDRGAEPEDGVTGLRITVLEGVAVVEEVEEGSPAMEAGVERGWVVESAAGRAVKSLFDLLDGTAEAKARLATGIVQEWLSGPAGSAVAVSFKTSTGKIASRTIGRRAPRGKLVQFGNLPPERVVFEHRKLASGAGYMRLNIFLDPVSVMPELEKSIAELRSAPGIVLDLRNNPGGLGVMAMGIAGWFVSQAGERLGTMTSRDMVMNFEINPRLAPYTGRLAIVVNQDSASTTEILAQGLQDLGRARIFGTRTAGEALPSEIIELADGDRFQYPEANYVSVKGRTLEGNGVVPDVVVKPTLKTLLEGRDVALEAAEEWAAGRAADARK